MAKKKIKYQQYKELDKFPRLKVYGGIVWWQTGVFEKKAKKDKSQEKRFENLIWTCKNIHNRANDKLKSLSSTELKAMGKFYVREMYERIYDKGYLKMDNAEFYHIITKGFREN
jgi:hypothetical protein